MRKFILLISAVFLAVCAAYADKVSTYTVDTSPAGTDILYEVKNPSTTPVSRSVTITAAVAAGINWSAFPNTQGYITHVNWMDIGGLQSGIDLSGFTNDSAFISGINWTQIGGLQSGINLSGFTNDSSFISGINWSQIGGLQSAVNISGFTNDSLYISPNNSNASGGILYYHNDIITGSTQVPPAYNSTYVKATTILDDPYNPENAFNTGTSLTGSSANASWAASSDTNQRLHVDLGSAKIITKFLYENYNSNGDTADAGAKNFTLWGSNNAGAFANTTYSSDTNWTQLTTSVSQFEKYQSPLTADEKEVLVTNSVAYRYYAFKFSNNWGGGVIALRRIELQTTSAINPAGWSSLAKGSDSSLLSLSSGLPAWEGTSNNIKVSFEGDSLTNYNNGGDWQTWPTWIMKYSPYFSQSSSTRNDASPGKEAATMASQYSTKGHLNRPTNNNDIGWYFIWGGTNDITIDGLSAATTYGYLQTIWAAARADRYRVVAFTMAPRTDCTSACETRRLAFNTLIRGDHTLYDYLVEPDIIMPNAADTTYYRSDGVHINNTGSLKISQLVNTVVNGVPYQVSPVAGSVTSPDLINGMNLNLVPKGGNVGIGTGVPTQKLTVEGSIYPKGGGYYSGDGTVGVTVTTCTGFKNGICISGT